MSLIRKCDAAKRLKNSPKLVCLARTFPKHAEELGNAVPEQPIFFLKSPNSIIHNGEPVRLPVGGGEVHHEGEIAVILARPLSNATPEQVCDAIAGYTVLNDVTERDVQKSEMGRFSRAKSYDTFCPMSDELLCGVNWSELSVQCLVNGQVRQHGYLTDMWMSPFALVAWISHHMSLNQDDIISLGTPPGVAPIVSGDLLETRLYLNERQVITLHNPVMSSQN
ncbi:MAG: fumarylacetoacetate hydrolase family protein [Bradymonadia bacterium]